MAQVLLIILDFLGTIAFAITGAVVAGRKGMDIFGVNVLAVATATGGGILRDLMIGSTPPMVFQNPIYAIVAILMANLVFIYMYKVTQELPKLKPVYNDFLFLFDTLGLAAFTVDGVLMGIRHGFASNMLLIIYLGVITGAGGGVLRDIFAMEMPEIFRKKIYALAAIMGAIATNVVYLLVGSQTACIFTGFAVVVIIRFLAMHFEWDLPRIQPR